jgi:hypothetical protein
VTSRPGTGKRLTFFTVDKSLIFISCYDALTSDDSHWPFICTVGCTEAKYSRVWCSQEGCGTAMWDMVKPSLCVVQLKCCLA